MSNETEQANRNKLIAEFMGIEVIPAGTIPIGQIKKGQKSEALLMYHSSWDWLMPVIEKISKIPFYEEGYPMFRFTGNPLFNGNTLIEVAYTAVVDFITFYNAQNPNQNEQRNRTNPTESKC